MVVGRTSHFVEGFKSFTADDELMLANLKQALEYSKENLSIPDTTSKLKLPSNNLSGNLSGNLSSTTTTPQTTKAGMGTTTTKANINNSNMMNQLPPAPTLAKLIKPQTTQNMEEEEPQTTMMASGGGMDGITSSSRMSEEKFGDLKMVKNIIEDGDSDDSDYVNESNLAIMKEDHYENKFNENKFKKNLKNGKRDNKLEDDDDNGEDMIEGFQGSSVIESRNARNILLALLLTAIGYLVVHSSMKNLIPLDAISPQLKKFKNLIYCGLFFVIAYICLEVL